MKAIKRQFKEFWLYFKCYKRGINVGTDGAVFKGNLFVIIVLVFSVVMFSSQIGTSANGFTFNIFHAFFIGAAFGIGACARIKPSFMSVAPFSPKQRIVYSYLSTVLIAIISCILWTIFVILFMALIGFFVFVASGENIFVISEDIIKKSDYYTGLDILFGLYMWLSVYAMSFIPRLKHRNIAFPVWFAVTEALVLVLVNVCNQAWAAQAGIEAYSGFMFATDIANQIEYLALPWLPVLITGLLALGAFAASLITSIRFFRTTEI